MENLGCPAYPYLFGEEMFKENKYTNWYKILISRAADRSKNNGIYFERHHIIPKSMGGDNSKSNLVLLTAKEHYIAHLLLTKMVYNNHVHKMTFALWRMSHGKQNDKRYMPSSNRYQVAKEKMCSAIRQQNLGQVVTERQKELLRKRIPWNKGKSMSSEFKDNLSKLRIGSTSSDDTRLKISKGVRDHYNQKKKSGVKGSRPRLLFDLEHISTGQVESTTNLKQWCLSKGFSSAEIYLGISEWHILQKTRLKDGKVIR